ncbi:MULTISPECIES: hypothetical protein [Aquimarina]|uniref:IrrE N-terminal-like domain-containing protein n=1 Tax=Aquimarina algiphila TaxID=2047982 RepID=A0A554VCH6_9FLAO|nr:MULTISPECIES: hypothetical protein [Aquimarina]TSE04403.1 hypothetical protein FOF46_26620 [Aquimarina algiphila]
MNLQTILNDIIKNAFPELMDEDIAIEWKNLEDALMDQGGLTGHGYFIEVDESLKKANEAIIVGGIAHELCHILADLKVGKWQILLDRVAYRIFKRYRTLDERNTDLQAIIRGYGSSVLLFMKYSENKGYNYYKEDGLSIREIEAILNNGLK